VDEAHATGVLGLQGRGLVCALGLEGKVFARLHTFGKALGCNGGMYLPSFVLPFPLSSHEAELYFATGCTS
jgi:8-amino-7-oxononanoate synthase